MNKKIQNYRKKQMWPNYVKGPYDLTTIEEININYGDGNISKAKICIFGEAHNTSQCNDNVMDVIRDSGEYTLIQGRDAQKWSIGRLLYVLAKTTQTKIDYFFELKFKEPEGSIAQSMINIRKIISLFNVCLKASKEACEFLPRVFMHAIDYRIGQHTYGIGGATSFQLRLFAKAFFSNDYKMIESFFPRALWNSFQQHYYVLEKDMLPTFTPLAMWESISSLCTKNILNLHEIEKDQKVVILLIQTLEGMYGSEFDITDIILIYLSGYTTDYIEYVEKKLTTAKYYLMQWESMLSEHELFTTTAFEFGLNITFYLKQYIIISERILQNNHPSIKRRTSGLLISRGAHQLLKVSGVEMKNRPILNALKDWIEYLKGELLSGFAWKYWFNEMFRGSKSPRKFLNTMLSEAAYCMDIPFIARMFARNSSLKVCYVGAAHAKRVREFFQFCRFNTNYVIAKENTCLEFPLEAKETFTDAVLTNPGINCEYCPSLAELKCNVCNQGHTCKADSEKWKKNHKCNKF
jgi:hypothetical protein